MAHLRNNNDKEILILIPAHNEADSIAGVLMRLRQHLLINGLLVKTEILVVNDCSTDNTAAIAAANGAKIINNFDHLGYGGSLQVGYRYCIDEGFKYVIQMDADGQHDPANVIKIYNALINTLYSSNGEGPDVVVGSRFLPGSISFKISALKKFAVWYFSSILKLVTKVKLTDPTSGLQGLSRAVVYYYSQFNQFDSKYPDSNILLEAARAGFQFDEIPAIMYAREDGVSMHSGFKPVYYMMHMTISVLSICMRRDLEERYLKAKFHGDK